MTARAEETCEEPPLFNVSDENHDEPRPNQAQRPVVVASSVLCTARSLAILPGILGRGFGFGRSLSG